MGYKGRDVEVVPLAGGQYLVVACDSCGAIGPKELDVVRVPNYIVGRFTARVALLEVVATGAAPVVLTATVCCESSPAGEEMLQGIRDELDSFGFPNLPVVISTEKNIPARQTGLGVSVVGTCDEGKLRLALSQPGDLLYCLGLPKVGPEVGDPADPAITQGGHLRRLLASPGVHDILPVGSRGIRGEAATLAAAVNCRLELASPGSLDLDKSAGPSTCVIFSCSPGLLPPEFGGTPLCRIGRLGAKTN